MRLAVGCDRIFTGGILFLILLTPFAFGAVQPWAYTLTEVVIFALVIVWMTKRAIVGRDTNTQHRPPNTQERLAPYALPLTIFIAFCAIQLVPLPPPVLKFFSPQTFETYRQILPGWPERVPYSELASMEQSAKSEEQSVESEQRAETARDLEGTRLETAESGPSPLPLTPLQTVARNPEQRAKEQEPLPLTPSPLAGPNAQHRAPETQPSLLPQTWLPLSLSPNLGRIDLLKFAAFAALFFLVWRYPFEKPFEDFEFQSAGSGFFVLSPEQRFCRLIMFAVLGTGLLVAALGFIERFASNGKIMLAIAGYDGGQPLADGTIGRASGPFINPDHFANYLSLILPLALGCALFRTFMVPRSQEYGLKIFGAFTTFLLFTGILLSLSRGGWIGALFGVVTFTWLAPWGSGRRRRAKRHSGRPTPNTQDPAVNPGSMLHAPSSKLVRIARLLAITLCLLLIVGLFLAGEGGREQVDARLGETFERDVDLAGRTTAWKDTLGMIRDFPLLGVGLGAWQDVFNHYESGPWSSEYFKKAHNDYIEILAETGIVGFTLLACFFVPVGRKLVAGLSKISSKYIPLLAAVLAASGSMAMHSSMDFSLQIPANALLFSVLLAIGLRLANQQRARSVESDLTANTKYRTPTISLERQAWSAEQWVGSREQGAERNQRSRAWPFAVGSLRGAGPLMASALAVALIGCAITQEEEPRRPESIAEARERLLWRPFKASYHLSVIGRVEDQAPPEWQLREYRAALWIQPTNPYIRDQIAEILMGMGERDQALNEMTLSVAHAPSLQMHEYLSAESLPELSAEERDAVEAGFKQALAWNYPEAFQALPEFYARQERFADQAALYEQAALKETDSRKKTELLMNAGVGYLKARSKEQGAGSVRTVDGRPETERLKNPKSEIQNPKFEDAERAFRAAIAANPTDPKPYQQLVTAVFAPKKDLPAAKETVSQGIKAGAAPLPLYLSFAEAAQSAGSKEEREAALKSAKKEVEKLIKSGESPYTLYMVLAEGARRAADREQEIAALLKALDLQPRSKETLSRLASVYSEKQNYDRAALYLNRITQINPDSADVYFGLAQAEESRFRFADAGRAYARALELAPQNESFRKTYETFKTRVDRNRLSGDGGQGLTSQVSDRRETGDR